MSYSPALWTSFELRFVLCMSEIGGFKEVSVPMGCVSPGDPVFDGKP